MILFVCDQVAGAEYIIPSILERNIAPFKYEIVASPVSSVVFARYGVKHQVLECLDRETVGALLDRQAYRGAVLSTSIESLLERTFALELQCRGIPFAQLIDQWSNYKSRFIYNNTLLYPNYILTLDSIAEKEMVAEGIPLHIIKIIGQPYLEFQTIKNKKNILIPKKMLNATRALLISQPISKYYQKTLGYTEYDFLETAFEAWKASGYDWSGLSIAVHPSEDKEKYLYLTDKYSKDIILQKNETKSDSELKIWDYTHVLGMFSLLMTQSALLGIPTASLQPNAIGRDFCFLSEKGYIPRLQQAEDCLNFLRGSDVGAAGDLSNIINGSITRFTNFLLEFK